MALSSKDNVLLGLADLLNKNRLEILHRNRLDMEAADGSDESLKDRLKVDGRKIDGMIRSCVRWPPKRTPRERFSTISHATTD